MSIRVAHVAAAGLVLAAGISLAPAAEAEVMVAGMSPKLCMDVNQSIGRIELHPCHGAANQNLFTASYGQQRFNGACLDTEHSGEGAQLIVATCNSGKRTQKWELYGNGTYRNESGHCADIPNADARVGQRVVQWRCNGGRNQVWGRGQLLTSQAVSQLTGRPLADITRLANSGSILSHNGSTLVGNDGASLVAAGGGNLVAAGGGNLVAAGGGNLVRLSGGAITGK